MNTAVIHVHRGGPLVALLGNPNCGKTALFNRLTGSRQKVANYAGVTVERKEGAFTSTSGRRLRLLDLPGTYSLVPRSPDERVTRDVLTGQAPGEKRPDLLLCVVDAGHLQRHLRLVLAARRLGLPMVVALNMSDLASRRGLHIDSAALQRELGVPVLPTVAVSGQGCDALRHCLDDPASWQVPAAAGPLDHAAADAGRVRQILAQAGVATDTSTDAADRADRLLLHPLAGPLLLAVLLFLVFQAVFAWAEAPMGWIESATAAAGHWLLQALPDHGLRSLLVDGVVAGVGGVLVFLPQILILFFFILVLEESGYLPRAAFLLDRLMGGVGLSGRLHPAAVELRLRHAGHHGHAHHRRPARAAGHDHAIAPLMTCSARLPVYALLIGAFVPARDLAGGIGLQGLVLFVLYVAGIAAAALLAWAAQRLGGGSRVRTLMMELPDYHWPRPRATSRSACGSAR
jgi:ferrous iron transport protein B